jgi:hypothetical protein
MTIPCSVNKEELGLELQRRAELFKRAKVSVAQMDKDIGESKEILAEGRQLLSDSTKQKPPSV